MRGSYFWQASLGFWEEDGRREPRCCPETFWKRRVVVLREKEMGGPGSRKAGGFLPRPWEVIPTYRRILGKSC